MKKLLSLLLCSALALSLIACGSKPANNDANNTTSNDSNNASSDTTTPAATPEPVDTSIYNPIVADLNSKINTNGEKNASIAIKTDVKDATSSDPHVVIEITSVDPDVKNNMNTTIAALNGGNATVEQKLVIQGVRGIVSDEAKNLPNDTDIIQYEVSKSILIAQSSKVKDFLPVNLVSEEETTNVLTNP